MRIIRLQKKTLYAAGDIVARLGWLMSPHTGQFRRSMGCLGIPPLFPSTPFPAAPIANRKWPASVLPSRRQRRKVSFVGKFPFAASGKAVAVNHSEGSSRYWSVKSTERFWGSYHWVGRHRIDSGIWIGNQAGSHG